MLAGCVAGVPGDVHGRADCPDRPADGRSDGWIEDVEGGAVHCRERGESDEDGGKWPFRT